MPITTSHSTPNGFLLDDGRRTFNIEVTYLGTRNGETEVWQYEIYSDSELICKQADLYGPPHEVRDEYALESLLTFLIACAEAQPKSGNYDLFDLRVRDTAVYWLDNLRILQAEAAARLAG